MYFQNNYSINLLFIILYELYIFIYNKNNLKLKIVYMKRLGLIFQWGKYIVCKKFLLRYKK